MTNSKINFPHLILENPAKEHSDMFWQPSSYLCWSWSCDIRHYVRYNRSSNNQTEDTNSHPCCQSLAFIRDLRCLSPASTHVLVGQKWVATCSSVAVQMCIYHLFITHSIVLSWLSPRRFQLSLNNDQVNSDSTEPPKSTWTLISDCLWPLVNQSLITADVQFPRLKKNKTSTVNGYVFRHYKHSHISLYFHEINLLIALTDD